VSAFSANLAESGDGGNRGAGGSATGGNGGSAGYPGFAASGGNAGSATSGSGGSAGGGGLAEGGGFYDDGAASFTGVTVNFTNNRAVGGSAGTGGNGGTDAYGGFAGSSHGGGAGGNGGNATGGNGGGADFNGLANGGGITVDVSGKLSLQPTLGAPKGSKQANAADLISGNSATPGAAGTAGSPGPNLAPGTGGGGAPVGKNGVFTVGQPGRVSLLKRSVGGGIAIFGTARGKSHTKVTGNSAIVFPNIDGTFSP
jgi:hypothetical protein